VQGAHRYSGFAGELPRAVETSLHVPSKLKSG
jgi:hypothetical protein